MTDSQTDKHPDNLGFKLINMKPRSQVRCNALGLKNKTGVINFDQQLDIRSDKRN